MSFHLAYVLLLAICLTSLRAQGTSLRWNAVVRESGRIEPDLAILRETADEMARLSPTFAQMLEIVQAAPRLIVLARPAALAGKIGQSQFYVASGRTFVVIDLNTYRVNPRFRVRAIAHELAHAVEIACLPRKGDTNELLQELVARAKSHSLPGIESAETAFPEAVEKVGLDEYHNKTRAESQLLTLAERYGLPNCTGSVGMTSNDAL